MKAFFDRFTARVAERPHSPAVGDAAKTLTFEQLDIASDRLAKLIHDAQTHEHEIIGHLGHPGADRVVALLAAIKAGSGLVRCDPEDVPAVLEDLIRTCEVDRIVAEPGFEAQAATLLPGVQPILIPQDLPQRDQVEPFRVSVHDREAIAGILYTSGSTGRPKCVPLTHHVLDIRQTQKDKIKLTSSAVPQRSAFFTNLRIERELATLQDGDMIDCFDFRRFGAAAAVDWLRERRINHLTGQVAIFRQLMAAAQKPFPDLNQVVLVGEAVGRTDLELFETYCLPGSLFAVRFASSEHTDVAIFKHRHGDPIIGDTVPLGEIYYPETLRLVDADGNDVVAGQPGEIVVTGDFLPHGYLKDPERTAEVFTQLQDGSGCWQCRSGFVAYKDAKGILHPVGRKDGLVRIRGYNVRPEEVEQMLQQHPGVRQAAVTAFEGAKNIRQLACHFLSAATPSPSAQELRQFMMERTPGYMVPSVFRPIAEMPLSGTGKILKSALPAVRPLEHAEQLHPVGALTPTERKLTAIWQEILGFDDFGIEDDFFDIGGDSLQAMGMVVAIEEAFGLRIAFEYLILDGSTIKILAGKIDKTENDNLPSVAVLREGGDKPPLFAVYLAGGHLSDYLLLAHITPVDQPVLGLRPSSFRDSRLTIEDIAADAVRTMREHTPNGPYRIIGYSWGGLVAFEMARQLYDNNESVSHLILLDTVLSKYSFSDLLKFDYAPWRHFINKRVIKTIKHIPNIGQKTNISARHQNRLAETHIASTRKYIPRPLNLPNVLLFSAVPNNDKIYNTIYNQKKWRKLIGGRLNLINYSVTHTNLVKEPIIFFVSKELNKFLNEPSA
jgi:acyl-CoA synthetase (AMP-forming)/AMP-acid ligase II/thioesterase domain-containing protein/acyl carrier protein